MSPEVWGDILKILSFDPTAADEKPAENFLQPPVENRFILEAPVADTSDKVAGVFHFSTVVASPDSMPPDTTVAQMLEYYKDIILKQYLNNPSVADSLAQWDKLKDEVVYWTENEKEALKKTIGYTIDRYKGDVSKMMKAILKACGHKIRKEILEKNQPRNSYEGVGGGLKKAGMNIKKQYKGDPDKPTFVFRDQDHGPESDPTVKNSQDSIYLEQIKLLEEFICTNFGFEGLPDIEAHPDLVPEKDQRKSSQYYGTKREKEFMKKYPNAFYFGIEDPETTEKANIADDNYLLMQKVMRHQKLQKVNFGKGMNKQVYLRNIKLPFAKMKGYKTLEEATREFLQEKQIVTYEDHSKLFYYFLSEWQRLVLNERNKKVIQILLMMAQNTGDMKGFVAFSKMGYVHTKDATNDMLWFHSLKEAEDKMFDLGDAAEAAGCSYYEVY